MYIYIILYQTKMTALSVCGFSFCLEVIKVDTTAKYIILSLKRCYHTVSPWFLKI